jgi:hypothetical protein
MLGTTAIDSSSSMAIREWWLKNVSSSY